MNTTSVYALILAFLVSVVDAYPIYKYGLFQGSSTTVDACGASGRRNKCFIWDLGVYPNCYKFSETESYSGAQFDTTSLTYDLHPQCTDCSCGTGAGRKGGSIGECNFFNFGGTYWLKLECVLNNAEDSCPEDYVECTDCVTGCTNTAPTPTAPTPTAPTPTAPTPTTVTAAPTGSGGSSAAPWSFFVAVSLIVLSVHVAF